MKATINCFRRIVAFLMMFTVSPLLAGTTGKISGTVRDAQTGIGLAGCNIFIEGTPLGAACDANGNYFIINVPPGTYTVETSMMGYRSTKTTGVKVMVDLTTKVNFTLEEQVVEGDTLIVVAERPLVQKDITSKLTVVDSREIINMAVGDFQDVLTTKAGFTRDADGNIHVRGGRTGEIAYMIDGMYVEDPLYGGFNQICLVVAVLILTASPSSFTVGVRVGVSPT